MISELLIKPKSSRCLAFGLGSVLFICTCRFHLSCLLTLLCLSFGIWLLVLWQPALPPLPQQGPPGSQPSPHAQLPPNANMMATHGQVTTQILHTFSMLIAALHVTCTLMLLLKYPPFPSSCL